MNWEETEQTLNALLEHIAQSGIKFDVIAPLLRTGGIVGGMLAIKMRVITMLPVQFKYSYHPTTINQILSIPNILVEMPSVMNILLAEGNTSSGSIAKRAAAAITEKYPHAKIYLATLTRVFGGPDQLDGIEQVFYGRRTDENLVATEEEKAQYNLREGITIFPWEDIEDELSDINAVE